MAPARDYDLDRECQSSAEVPISDGRMRILGLQNSALNGDGGRPRGGIALACRSIRAGGSDTHFSLPWCSGYIPCDKVPLWINRVRQELHRRRRLTCTDRSAPTEYQVERPLGWWTENYDDERSDWNGVAMPPVGISQVQRERRLFENHGRENRC